MTRDAHVLEEHCNKLLIEQTMGLLKKMKNRILKKETLVKPSINNRREPSTIEQSLKKINKLHVNKQTSKSRVSLIQNYGEYSDINLAFAYVGENKIRVSDGFSYVSKSKSLTLEEWCSLEPISLQNKRSAILLKTINTPESKQLIRSYLLPVNDYNALEETKKVLLEINEWASMNYPLVVGIDEFSQLADLSSIDLLSFILSTTHLKYIFYHRGTNSMNFLNIPEPDRPEGKVCPKGYLPEDSKQHNFLNCMIELKNLLQQYDKINADIFKEALLTLQTENLHASSSVFREIELRSMNVYDNELKMFLLPNTSKYRMGFSMEGGGTYVSFDNNSRKFRTNEKYIMVSRDTQVMLNEELLDAVSKIDISRCKLPRIRWIDGVPGSGKTHLIVDKHRPMEDLILTQTRAAIKGVRSSIQEKHGNEFNSIINSNYRTVTSFLINGRHKKYKRVFIDEAVLMHAGFVGFVSELTGAEEVVLVGDSKQISYIERSGLPAVWKNISVFADPDSYQSVTNRCPMDVCCLLSNYYNDICTTNKIIRSIKPTITNGEPHNLGPQTLILTFTQSEKQMVLEAVKNKAPAGSLTILTIHEAQGLTFRDVILVRKNTKPLKIYNSVQHIIVALSRHTNSFRYLTVGEQDLMLSLTQKIQSVDYKDICNWHANNYKLKNNNG